MKKKYLLFAVIAVLALVLTTACTKEENKKEETKKEGTDYLVLVNKLVHVPDDWEKNLKLVNAKNAWDEDIQLEEKAYEAYKKLANELKEEGVIIELDSVFRSVQAQQDLWDNWSKDPEKGVEYAKKYAAVPGYSEHHTGLAVDICIKKDGELIYDNDEMKAEREIFAKVHKKLAKYGFILRYLENREDSTGYTYEPWHLRYINDPTLAKKIMDKNMTYEEYLATVKDFEENEDAAKYQISIALQDYLNSIYGDKITNSRFDFTKLYITEEDKKSDAVKDLKLGKNDIAFEVTYQVLPAEGVDITEITRTGGALDEQLGWVTNIQRVGVLVANSGRYKITNFRTNF